MTTPEIILRLLIIVAIFVVVNTTVLCVMDGFSQWREHLHISAKLMVGLCAFAAVGILIFFLLHSDPWL